MKRPGYEKARERIGQGVRRPGSEKAREQKGQGAKVPGSELARVLLADSLRGANWPGSEKARYRSWKVFRIGTVRYHWPMSAHASQAFSIASCTDSEDLPRSYRCAVQLCPYICDVR